MMSLHELHTSLPLYFAGKIQSNGIVFGSFCSEKFLKIRFIVLWRFFLFETEQKNSERNINMNKLRMKQKT